MTPAEARSLLGLSVTFDEADVSQARRRLSVIHHPDRGGDTETMSTINAAVDLLLTTFRAEPPAPGCVVPPTPGSEAPPTHATFHVSGVDHPSFVVDALPVVAYEVVALAVVAIGEIIDEDPPYSVEFSVAVATDSSSPSSRFSASWCRLEIVPDAGSSTVSLMTDGRHDVESLRDLLVSEINRIGLAD
ncbi:MAG: DnaJ family molecular chaperone [Acidimicrobiia bacterium]